MTGPSAPAKNSQAEMESAGLLTRIQESGKADPGEVATDGPMAAGLQS